LLRHSFATSFLHIRSIGTSPDVQDKECMMRKIILIGAVSAIALAAAAYALPTSKPSKMDLNGNGVVTKVEAMTAADAMFTKMDVNGDGAVNAADREAKVKIRFQQMDADKNGAISEAELIAAHDERADDRAEKRAGRGPDGHHGGRHGRGHKGGRGGEGGHAMGLMKAADANKDQAVTKAEFQAAAEARFAKSDTNKDGSLSSAEVDAAKAAMRALRAIAPAPVKAVAPAQVSAPAPTT
jgi:EF hand